jgi:hypothetical protein
MSYIDFFSNNTNYTCLFQIRSEVTKCEVQEVVELYRHKLDHYYVLFRYQITNNTMPLRFTHKFTTAISIETSEEASRSSLELTTAYHHDLSVCQKINICCGSKSYVLKVEQALYRHLF